MESSKVIEAATKVIASINEARKEENERAIKNAMRLQTRFSFKRGFYRMNREEAIEWIDNNESRTWGWSQLYWGTMQKAKDLLLLAQHGEPVTLNEKDVATLFGSKL
jgi:hypothetical protein